jgi:uncharacterized protein (DUF3820 family)
MENERKILLIQGSTRIPFGMYKNKPAFQILQMNPFYMKWMISADLRSLEFEDNFAKKIVADIELADNYSMPFGRMKGKTLRQILKNNIQYFAWLITDLFPQYDISISKNLNKDFELRDGLDIVSSRSFSGSDTLSFNDVYDDYDESNFIFEEG